MGIARGTNIITDGLIYGYDTGFGVADKDTKTRFYQGKPSSNLLQNTTALDNTSSWARSKNSGSAPTVTANTSPNPLGSEYPGMADKVYIPDDGTYPRIAQSFTPASTNTHHFSIWIRSLSGACGIFLGIFRNSPWSLPGQTTIGNDQITSEWKRFSFSFTPADTSSHQIYMGAHDAAAHKGNTLEFWGAQIEEESDRTPFMDAITTQSSLRAASGGDGGCLIDLKRTRDISIVNMSFNSAQQPTFDGTDDKISTGISTQLNAFSCVVVFKDGGSATWGRIVDKSYTDGFFISSRWNGNASHVGAGVREPNAPHGQHLSYDNTKYNYFAVTRDGANHDIYLNGSSNTASKTNGDSSTLSSTEMHIGSWYDNRTSQRYTGEIPVMKLYNKKLSAAEIQQDFEAYKNRFNL